MSTRYSPKAVKKIWWLNLIKRHQIPSTSLQPIPQEDKLGLVGELDPWIK